MNKRIAFIFPGQGAQYPGMGKDLYEKSDAARKVFEKADKALKFSLSQICFQGCEEEIKKTDLCQPAILTMSIAALEALKESSQIAPQFSAGLSLGEYSALVAAGVLTFEDALNIVRKRGELMEMAAKQTQGKMASIIGLDETKVRGICKKNGCFVANLNCPGQIVISGEAKTIDIAAKEAEEQGASRVIELAVSGAFHSPLMKTASDSLAQELNKYRFNTPKIDVVFNVTAGIERNPDKIKDNLLKQVASSVLWEASMRLILSQGVEAFIEVGPGKVLKGLMRRIEPSAAVYNIETSDSAKAVIDQLKSS